MNLDIRDFEYWLKEAQKKKISSQIDRLLMLRFSMYAKGMEFSKALNKLKFELAKLEGTAMQIIEDKWEALRLKGRG